MEPDRSERLLGLSEGRETAHLAIAKPEQGELEEAFEVTSADEVEDFRCDREVPEH